MFNLTQYFKNKGYENKIDFYNLKNSNFIATQVVDVTVFWLNILSNDNEVVYVDEIVVVFYSKNNDYYTIYFTNETHFLNSFLNSKLENLLNNGNKLHYVLSDSSNRNFLLEFFENKFEHQNLKYSIANINSEVFYEDEPYDLKNLKKVSYIFTGGSIVNRNGESWVKENKSKIVLSFMYSLTYFYHKFGFCYYQPGENKLDISNRENKVFLYSKNAGLHTSRTMLIKKAISTGKVYEKEYSESDWFWYYVNYNYYHMPFFYDYNICKFNIVTETQDPTMHDEKMNHFLSEKTLKALMVSTPCYVLLQSDVYKELADYGFYFLNSEFGEYNDDNIPAVEYLKHNPKKWNENYHKFINFLKTASDTEFDDMFKKAYEKSKNNKVLLEKYFQTNKTMEINLLLGRDGRVG
jgi:hypothetical protein